MLGELVNRHNVNPMWSHSTVSKCTFASKPLDSFAISYVELQREQKDVKLSIEIPSNLIEIIYCIKTSLRKLVAVPFPFIVVFTLNRTHLLDH